MSKGIEGTYNILEFQTLLKNRIERHAFVQIVLFV